MEIRVLRYFLAIAREGSLTNASNFLHVTQPTLSRQIHDLEEELGQKLFTRSSLCFRPLEPRLDSGLDIVWKKYQVFSSAAELFLERLQQDFENQMGNDR